MMKKKKLILNKEIIANLGNEEMKYMVGGAETNRCEDTAGDLKSVDPNVLCCRYTTAGNTDKTCYMCTIACTIDCGTLEADVCMVTRDNTCGYGCV